MLSEAKKPSWLIACGYFTVHTLPGNATIQFTVQE